MNLLDELKKFLKFNVVGLINTLVDFVIYSILTYFGIIIAVAQIISYSVGMATSFLLNSKWTFKDTAFTMRKLIYFIIVNLSALAVSMMILYFCRNHWKIEGMLAKLISLPFSLSINFIGNRLFVFNSK